MILSGTACHSWTVCLNLWIRQISHVLKFAMVSSGNRRCSLFPSSRSWWGGTAVKMRLGRTSGVEKQFTTLRWRGLLPSLGHTLADSAACSALLPFILMVFLNSEGIPTLSCLQVDCHSSWLLAELRLWVGDNGLYYSKQKYCLEHQGFLLLIPWVPVPTRSYKESQVTQPHVVDYLTGEGLWH